MIFVNSHIYIDRELFDADREIVGRAVNNAGLK